MILIGGVGRAARADAGVVAKGRLILILVTLLPLRGWNVAILQVTCINKRPSHYDPHERIEAIGGSGWKHLEDDAIRRIELQTDSYYVNAAGRRVRVIVETHNRRKYLKTEADGYAPNNLLALPECP